MFKRGSELKNSMAFLRRPSHDFFSLLCYAKFFLCLYRGADTAYEIKYFASLFCMKSGIRWVFSVHLYCRVARRRVVSQVCTTPVSIWHAVLNRSLHTWKESPLQLHQLVNGFALWQNSLMKEVEQVLFLGIVMHWHHMKLIRYFK